MHKMFFGFFLLLSSSLSCAEVVCIDTALVDRKPPQDFIKIYQFLEKYHRKLNYLIDINNKNAIRVGYDMLATLSRENLPSNTWDMDLVQDLAYHLNYSGSFEKEVLAMSKSKAERLLLLYDSDQLLGSAYPNDYPEIRERVVHKKGLFPEEIHSD